MFIDYLDVLSTLLSLILSHGNGTIVCFNFYQGHSSMIEFICDREFKLKGRHNGC